MKYKSINQLGKFPSHSSPTGEISIQTQLQMQWNPDQTNMP